MAYIFDIDGTLADCSQRLHFIQPPEGLVHFEVGETDWKPDWESFYKDCVNDKPIQPVLDLLLDLQSYGAQIIFITGRPCEYMDETMRWLEIYTGERVRTLWMRETGDHRPDYIIKKEIYEKYLSDEYIDGVFEDRKQCVDMWRSLGLTCYQVADGNY